jgi:Zn-dependent peptidase ImmA (M78 family)
MMLKEEVKVAYLIKKQVADLLKRLGLASPPIDVQRIAKSLGIEIVEISADIWFGGMYMRFHGRTYLILNRYMSQAAKRITVAKGIARYVLEKNLPNHEFTELQFQLHIERFAHELCVPSEMLKERLMKQIDYSYLASIFDVTEGEIARRLKELGLTKRGKIERKALEGRGWQQPAFLLRDDQLGIG